VDAPPGPLATVDNEVLPVVVDPGAEASRPKFESDYDSSASLFRLRLTLARRGRQGQARGRDRELSVLRSAARAEHEGDAARRDAHKLAQAKRAVEEVLERVPWAQSS
ncbi:MAG: hypothetical protein WAL09_04285, partial [Pseudolabrys sp.]